MSTFPFHYEDRIFRTSLSASMPKESRCQMRATFWIFM